MVVTALHLEKAQAKPARCQTCPGYAWGTHGYMAKPDGKSDLGVLLVTEALSDVDAEHGKPFQGRAGLALDQMLQRGDLRREQFLIDSTLRCVPPRGEKGVLLYGRDEVAACGHHLDATIALHRPRVIVPLGEAALRRVLGLDYLPKGEKFLTRRGYPEWSIRYNAWVVPTFAPSWLMSGQRHLTPVFLADLRKAMRIAKEGFAPLHARLISDPSLDTVERFVGDFERALAAGEDVSLAYDIETPYKADADDEGSLEIDDPTYIILRIGFAWRDTEALSLAWEPHYLPYIGRLLSSHARKLTWNGRYDAPRVARAGFPAAGEEHDLMWAFHILESDKPKGLGFVASYLLHEVPRWKHLANNEPGKYNALDALVTKRLEGAIIPALKATEQWSVFDRHIVKLDRILDAMSKRGVRQNATARVEFARRFAAELDVITAKMAAAIPPAARRQKVYKTKPKDTTTGEFITREVVKALPVCSSCGLEKPKKDHFKLYKKKVNPCAGAEVVASMRPKQEWVRLEPFVPSNDQLKRYLEFKGHQAIIDRGSRAPTFNLLALKKLWAKYDTDPVYPLVAEYREVETILARYLGWPVQVATGEWGVQGGMPVGHDGRIHTTFLHNPSTLRLSSQAPNLQNMPRGGKSEVQSSVKKLIMADPGEELFELDYKAIEAVLVGYLARSARYVRLAKLGVHDFLNAHILIREGKISAESRPELAWSDADLKALFKDLKTHFDHERNIAKRIVHLSNYGGTPHRIRESNPELFPTIRHAASLQGLYFEVCPEIRRWQQESVERADNGAQMRNAFNYVHHFFHVKEWFRHDGRWEWKWGEDAKAVLAFQPQSLAAAIIKEAMIRIDEAGYGDYLLLQVHDSLLGRAPKTQVDEVQATIQRIMEEPVPQLPMSVLGDEGYLQIEVEGKRGTVWGEMK